MNSLSNLVTISNILSVYSHIKSKSLSNILTSKDKEIINRTYYIFLSNIQFTLISNEEIKQRSYSIFELAWIDYCKGIGDIIKNQITLPDLLLPQPKRAKITDLELFKGVLAIFIALYDMRQITLHLISGLLIDKFPLSYASLEYNAGNKINLLDSQIESFEASIKKHCSLTYHRIVLILYLNYMFICKQDANDEYTAIIEEKYPLRQIFPLKDCMNKRELFIDVRDDRETLIEQMKIQLNGDMLCNRAYDKITEYVAYTKANESKTFEVYITQLINEWELIQ